MAIHPEVPGLEVKVCVQGQPLDEYDDDKIPEPKTTTKYIKSRSGKSFSIVTEFRTPFPDRYDVLARISVDGVMMYIGIRKRDELFQGWKFNTHRSHQGGEWVKQKFTFAKLNITEEADKAAPDVVALEQILSIKGCITLSLNFAEFIREVVTDETSYNDDRHQQLAALQDIPEKALKGDALSHQAILSKPRKCQSKCPGQQIQYKFVDEKPFATFHFRYRSLASIKALHLNSINEAPPVPLEDRLAKDLSPKELRELLNRAQQRESESTSIKAEDEATTGVKRERTIDDDDEVTYVETRQRKRPHMEQEIIVLD